MYVIRDKNVNWLVSKLLHTQEEVDAKIKQLIEVVGYSRDELKVIKV